MVNNPEMKTDYSAETSKQEYTRRLEEKGKVKRTEITLMPILNELLKKLWLIGLVAFICGIGADIYCHLFIAPSYLSSFTAYVNNAKERNSDTVTNSDMQARIRIVKTYSQVIKSKAVMQAAIEKMGSGQSANELLSYVQVEPASDSEVITVNVTTENPDFSYELANAIADVAPTYLEDVVEGSSMRIIDSPELPTSSVAPVYAKWLIGGFAGGLILIVLILVIRFIRDDTVKNENDLENYFSLPVVGIIPDMDNAMSANGYSYNYDYNYYNYSYGYGDYYYKKPSNNKSGGDEDGSKK